MQGLDISPELKDLLPAKDVGAMYTAVRYVYETGSSFDLSKSSDLRSKLQLIALLLGSAIKKSGLIGEVISEEVTSNGEGSGLELEKPAPEGLISHPFDPEKIDVFTTTRTVSLLITRLKENELILSPDFQRRANLWNEEQKSSLIESLLLRIPIPSLYVSEEKNGDYTVVDGLQRICAIAHFVDYVSLNRAVKANPKLVALRLKDIASLGEYNGNSFDELPRSLQRRIQETELTLHVIRASTPPGVKFSVFSRINRGGLPLTAQEIRNAIYHGKWRTFVHKIVESNYFLDATNRKIKGERMQDHELILRFIAHYKLFSKNGTREPEGNLEDFLNTFVEKDAHEMTDADWDDAETAFQRAVIAASEIFGYIAFRKYSEVWEARKPINRGLFEAETVAIACCDNDKVNELKKRSIKVILKFKDYFESDREFENSLQYATGRGASTNKRIEIINKIFQEVLK